MAKSKPEALAPVMDAEEALTPANVAKALAHSPTPRIAKRFDPKQGQRHGFDHLGRKKPSRG